MNFFLKHHGWPYDSLIKELSDRGVFVFNFGPAVMKHIKNNDPCSLYNSCFGHFNKEGYKILANAAYELLRERQLLTNIGIQSNHPDTEVTNSIDRPDKAPLL